MSIASARQILSEQGINANDLITWTEQIENGYFYGHITTSELRSQHKSLFVVDGTDRDTTGQYAMCLIDQLVMESPMS
jgi:uncharacterized protein with ParB-like and HNH nuclease domain